jgi:hypothetical protein
VQRLGLLSLLDWTWILLIYIPLRNEGTDCWRPIEAEQVGSDTYRIVGSKPEDEDWPVASGEVVRCELRHFADGFEGLAVINFEKDPLSGIS